ncbi:MAG: glutaredoxin family protein [Candidatus Diapherotrites archaeon]
MAVIVYTLPNCPTCKLAKEFLKENNIVFESYDVIEDKEKAREMVEKRRSVRTEDDRDVHFPVIDANGKILNGFSAEELRDALGMNK